MTLNNSSEPILIKASYFQRIFALLLMILVIISSITYLVGGEDQHDLTGKVIGSTLACLGSILLVIIVFKNKVIISSTKVIKSSLFGSKIVDLSEVTKATLLQVKRGLNGKGPLLLSLYTGGTTNKPVLVIDSGVLGEKGIKLITQQLEQKAICIEEL